MFFKKAKQIYIWMLNMLSYTYTTVPLKESLIYYL